MPIEALHASTLYAFALVLARVSGVFVFLPIPVLNNSPALPRIVLSLVSTIALFPRWPDIPAAPADIGQFAGWMLAEVGFGLSIGLAVSFIVEVLLAASQIVSVQAGFSYASTVDPTTNADSTVLVVMAQLVSALLFFTTGLDRQVLSTLAASLQSSPPGIFVLTRSHAEALLMLGSSIFATGLRLVLPIITMLLLVDLSLGMIGRINAQLQVYSLAMPLKMLASLALLSGSMLMFPRIFERVSTEVFAVLGHTLGW